MHKLKFPLSKFLIPSRKYGRHKCERHIFIYSWQPCISILKRSLSSIDLYHHKHADKHEDPSTIRNVGIMAHIDAGKTTTTEHMLYLSGFTKYMGEVDHGNTVTDFLEQERNRGISIMSAAVTFHWKRHKVNLIDTPGHVDFTVEVERTLRVMDGCVAILDASAGVEAQTLTVWKQADHHALPRIIYLNKMDKARADVQHCLDSIRDKLHVHPLLLQSPVITNGTFTGLVDLITMEKYIWNNDNHLQMHHLNRDEDKDSFDDAYFLRSDLIGQLSDIDNKIADLVLNDVTIDKISVNDVRDAVRRMTLSQKVVPVFLGSSFRGKGIETLLDGINFYLPCPDDRHYSFLPYYNNELCSLAFKVMHKKGKEYTFMRLYSGQLRTGDKVYNMNRDVYEKVNKLMLVNADEFSEVMTVHGGNIVCVSGLTQTLSGDTLVSSQSAAERATSLFSQSADVKEEKMCHPKSAILAGFEVPDPVFFCAIEPPSLMYEKPLNHALSCLVREDPSLKVKKDADSGQLVISGMGELHLEVIRDRISDEYGIDATLGRIEISYREAVKQSSEATEMIERTINDRRQTVTIHMSMHPCDTFNPFQKVEIIWTQENQHLRDLNRKELEAINQGVTSSLLCGPLLRYPVIGVKVCLHDIIFHKSVHHPFISAAASQAVEKMLQTVDTELLEPMMHLEIVANNAHSSVVLSDLSRRRSHIEAIDAKDSTKVIKSLTPLAEIVGYSTALRTMSSGTAYFTMQFACYESMNNAQRNKVIEHLTGFVPT